MVGCVPQTVGSGQPLDHLLTVGQLVSGARVVVHTLLFTVLALVEVVLQRETSHIPRTVYQLTFDNNNTIKLTIWGDG